MSNKISNIKERVLQIPEFKGITKAKFFNEIGMSYGNFTGKSKETPLNSNAISNISSIYPDIDLKWLITGDGDMIKKEFRGVKESNQVYKLRTDKILDHQSIPLYDIESTLGIMPVFNNINNQQPIDHLYIPNAPKCDGAIYATGDSMYPLIKSGDIQAYKIITDFKNDIFWGEKYILSIDLAGDEFLTTKFVQKSDKGDDYIKIVSQNKNHQDKDVKISKIRAMALVKMVVRYETSM